MNDDAVTLINRGVGIAGKHRSHRDLLPVVMGVIPDTPRRLIRGQASLQRISAEPVGVELARDER
jgi:hypothetical protein